MKIRYTCFLALAVLIFACYYYFIQQHIPSEEKHALLFSYLTDEAQPKKGQITESRLSRTEYSKASASPGEVYVLLNKDNNDPSWTDLNLFLDAQLPLHARINAAQRISNLSIEQENLLLEKLPLEENPPIFNEMLNLLRYGNKTDQMAEFLDRNVMDSKRPEDLRAFALQHLSLLAEDNLGLSEAISPVFLQLALNRALAPELRARAIQALASQKPLKLSMDMIDTILNDEQEPIPVRCALIESLSLELKPQTAKHLLEIARNPNNAHTVRASAMAKLGAWRDPASFETIKELAHSRSARIAKAASIALAEFEAVE